MIAALPPAIADQARLFWTWWTSELDALLPQAVRRLARAAPRADIRPSRDGVIVDRETEEVGERLCEARRLETLDAEGWTELDALIRGARARIVLTAPDLYMTRLVLPAAARGRLRSAIALQLRQIAPVAPEHLVWSFRIADADRRGLTIVVAMAKIHRIAQIRTLFEDNGIASPPIVGRDGDHDIELAAGADGSLTPERRRRRRAFAIAAALIASVPLTTWAAANLLAWHLEGRARTLHEALAPRLAEDQARAREEPTRRALNAVFELPSASSLIEGLALGLPDSAFAVSAERHQDGRFAFEAETADRAALEGALAGTPMLSGVHPAEMAPAEDGRLLLSFAGVPR